MAEPLLHIALLRPLIPQNTGTIGRLAMASRCRLHLVGTLGFRTDEKACRRAGLDYWRDVDWHHHADLPALDAALPDPGRLFAFSARAARRYTDVEFRRGDALLFGDEERGLPDDVVQRLGERVLRIPQLDPRVRSLNLANAASIALYEAMRQLGFPGDAAPAERAVSREVRPELRGQDSRASARVQAEPARRVAGEGASATPPGHEVRLPGNPVAGSAATVRGDPKGLREAPLGPREALEGREASARSAALDSREVSCRAR